MNKNIKNSLGLAQIPLLFVLLLMAIAVSAATKLVQDNADSRNMAAGGTLCVSLTCSAGTKYISEYRRTGGDLCKCGVAPTAKPTVKPGGKAGVPTSGLTGGTSSKTCSSQGGYFLPIYTKCVGGGKVITSYSDHRLGFKCCEIVNPSGEGSSMTCKDWGGYFTSFFKKCSGSDDFAITNYSNYKFGKKCCIPYSGNPLIRLNSR